MAVRIDHLALAAHDAWESARPQLRGITHRADPQQRGVGQCNTHDGGRGPYLDDPAGHHLEVITRRYGSGG